MPKGKKTCPQCQTEHGARKLKCECGYEFIRGKIKQEKDDKHPGVRTSKHPLIGTHEQNPGMWVYGIEKGMPKIPIPEQLPRGMIYKQEIYEYTVYNGVGDTIFSNIPPERIKDPTLRKKWKKAQDAMKEAWRYLLDGPE